MGSESFFLNIKPRQTFTMTAWEEFLKSRDFSVKSYSYKNGGLFSKRIVREDELAIQSIVRGFICGGEITLEGCLSCYESAVFVICYIAKFMAEKGLVTYAFHGEERFSPEEILSEDFEHRIDEINSDKLKTFRRDFTDHNLLVLPDNAFFSYFKRRKSKLRGAPPRMRERCVPQAPANAHFDNWDDFCKDWIKHTDGLNSLFYKDKEIFINYIDFKKWAVFCIKADSHLPITDAFSSPRDAADAVRLYVRSLRELFDEGELTEMTCEE